MKKSTIGYLDVVALPAAELRMRVVSYDPSAGAALVRAAAPLGLGIVQVYDVERWRRVIRSAYKSAAVAAGGTPPASLVAGVRVLGRTVAAAMISPFGLSKYLKVVPSQLAQIGNDAFAGLARPRDDGSTLAEPLGLSVSTVSGQALGDAEFAKDAAELSAEVLAAVRSAASFASLPSALAAAEVDLAASIASFHGAASAHVSVVAGMSLKDLISYSFTQVEINAMRAVMDAAAEPLVYAATNRFVASIRAEAPDRLFQQIMEAVSDLLRVGISVISARAVAIATAAALALREAGSPTVESLEGLPPGDPGATFVKSDRLIKDLTTLANAVSSFPPGPVAAIARGMLLLEEDGPAAALYVPAPPSNADRVLRNASDLLTDKALRESALAFIAAVGPALSTYSVASEFDGLEATIAKLLGAQAASAPALRVAPSTVGRLGVAALTADPNTVSWSALPRGAADLADVILVDLTPAAAMTEVDQAAGGRLEDDFPASAVTSDGRVLRAAVTLTATLAGTITPLVAKHAVRGDLTDLATGIRLYSSDEWRARAPRPERTGTIGATRRVRQPTRLTHVFVGLSPHSTPVTGNASFGTVSIVGFGAGASLPRPGVQFYLASDTDAADVTTLLSAARLSPESSVSMRDALATASRPVGTTTPGPALAAGVSRAALLALPDGLLTRAVREFAFVGRTAGEPSTMLTVNSGELTTPRPRELVTVEQGSQTSSESERDAMSALLDSLFNAVLPLTSLRR